MAVQDAIQPLLTSALSEVKVTRMYPDVDVWEKGVERTPESEASCVRVAQVLLVQEKTYVCMCVCMCVCIHACMFAHLLYDWYDG